MIRQISSISGRVYSPLPDSQFRSIFWNRCLSFCQSLVDINFMNLCTIRTLSPPPKRLRFTLRLSVCLSVCLFVCLLKTSYRMHMRIIPNMYLWTRKISLSFGSHSIPAHLHLDLGTFQIDCENMAHGARKTAGIFIKISKYIL